MPVKLGSKLPESEARIEIIPLIDIMFFLLASFMLVSLSMAHRTTVPVNLPTSTSAAADANRDLVMLAIDASGAAYLDDQPMAAHELGQRLAALRAANPEVRVSISGDRDARHGDVIRVLDAVRGAGIQRVAFESRSVGDAVTP